ncbi:hypothetical protein M0R45_019732 [Rubus argutus]|uniref:Uncharacterized protein n=1 Tax=Rubus argutus TaxID=59490 RepID=A0AAW1X727_RUBAR
MASPYRSLCLSDCHHRNCKFLLQQQHHNSSSQSITIDHSRRLLWTPAAPNCSSSTLIDHAQARTSLSTLAGFSLHPHHEPVLLAAPQPWILLKLNIPSPHSRRAHPLPWLQSHRRLQITDPLSAQPCSSSVVVPSDAAINHRPPRAISNPNPHHQCKSEGDT